MNTENYHRHEGYQQGFSDEKRTSGIMSKPKKIRVRPDNTVVLTCTNCGFQKEAQAESFKDYKHAVKIKCRCQKTFMVFLEYRNRVRKKTNLRGTYINHSQKDSSGFLIIRDISVTGLSFTSLDIKNFKVDDELRVEFALDDEHRTIFRKDLIIKDVRKNSVGCEYDGSEDVVFQNALGYYVMS